MLRIRFTRLGRHKRPFYRIILVEHTQPAKTAWMEVFGRYDPILKKHEVDVESIKSWIAKWAKPTSSVARLLFKITNEEAFKKFIKFKNTKKQKKNPDKYEK